MGEKKVSFHFTIQNHQVESYKNEQCNLNLRYNEIFFMIDTCQAASMFQASSQVLFAGNTEGDFLTSPPQSNAEDCSPQIV